MNDKELIQKIKKLGKIEPSEEWLSLTKHNLTAHIDFESAFRPASLGAGVLNWLKQPQSFALVMCLIFIFAGGPWLMVKASQPSLPGEWLYSVKKVSEGIQTKVASDNSKAQLQVDFASRRLEELTKITEDSFTKEEKTEKVKEVIGDLKNNLAGASIYADKISKEEAIAIAKKAKKIKENIDKNKEGITSEDVENDLAEAEKSINEINYQVLSVLIGDDAGNIEIGDNATSTIDEEVLIFLKETEDGTITTTEEVVNGETKE